MTTIAGVGVGAAKSSTYPCWGGGGRSGKKMFCVPSRFNHLPAAPFKELRRIERNVLGNFRVLKTEKMTLQSSQAIFETKIQSWAEIPSNFQD